MKTKVKRRVLYKWIISYILILIIPILLGFALLFNTQRIVVEVYNVMNQALYKQIGKVIDTHINKMDTVRQLLLSNTELHYFANLIPDATDENWYNLVIIQNQFSSCAASYNFNKFYVYLDNIDAVLTPESLYTKELTFNTFHSKSMIDMDEWFEYINQYHARTIRVIKSKDSESFTAVMIQSVPNLSIYRPRATIVQILEQKEFAGIINDIVIDDYTELMLIDSENNILISNTDLKGKSKIDYSLLSDLSGQIEASIDGESKLVFYQSSSIPGWKYVTMISKDAINEKTGNIRVYTYGFLFFSIVLGFILSYFVACYNYNPVKRIIASISPYIDKDCEKYEYDQIEDAFSNIIEAKENLDLLIHKQTAIMQRGFFESILRGQIRDIEQIKDIISSFNVSFNSELFCVLVLCIDSYRSEPNDSPGLIYRVFDGIRKDVQECECKNILMYPVELENLMAVLINFDKDYDDKIYHVMCDRILNLIISYEEQVFATVSKVYSGMSTAHLAYSEAMEAMNYKLIVFREDPESLKTLSVESGSDRRYIYTLEQEELLINLLSNKNDVGAMKLFNEICQNNFLLNHMTFNTARCFFYDVASSVFKLANRKVNMPEYSFKAIENFLGELNRAESSRDMRDIVESLISYVCESVKNDGIGLTLYDEIVFCVKEHFHENDFNVSKLADYLSMNMSYLSKYFKDNTGIGLLDYINRIRINCAKELLLINDFSINDVSVKSGFDNVNSFIRVFKKYEGITPGLYQNQIFSN